MSSACFDQEKYEAKRCLKYFLSGQTPEEEWWWGGGNGRGVWERIIAIYCKVKIVT